MAAESRTITTALRDALRANHAHYNLSTSGSTAKVLVGEPRLDGPPVAAPFVFLGPPSLTWTYESDMGQYVMQGTHEWAGIVASDAPLTSKGEVILDALDLVDDIATAWLSGHADDTNTALYALESLLLAVADVYGGGPMGTNYGVAMGTVTWRKHLTAGG